jgi:hypothetical protein
MLNQNYFLCKLQHDKCCVNKLPSGAYILAGGEDLEREGVEVVAGGEPVHPIGVRAEPISAFSLVHGLLVRRHRVAVRPEPLERVVVDLCEDFLVICTTALRELSTRRFLPATSDAACNIQRERAVYFQPGTS